MKVGVCVKSKQKMNHKGMTLVEVIVAMAILAIVITPTLRIFASASGTNLESRKRQRATSVAEGTMESMKAYTMEQLCNQFKVNGFKGVVQSTDSGRPTTMNAWAVKGGVDEYPFRSDGSLKKDADCYKMQARNVISEGQYYDVDILATPSPGYVADVLSMENMNAYSDAIISLSESSAYTAKTALVTKAKKELDDNFSSYHPTATSHTIDTVTVSDFKREISMAVTDDGTVQKVVLKVNYSCKAQVDYTYNSGTGSRTYDQTVLNCQEVLDAVSGATELAVYDNTDTIAGEEINGKRAKLHHLYLYYFPVYTSEFGSGARDEIKLDASLTGLYAQLPATSVKDSEARGYGPLQITIAKQKAMVLTDVQLNSGEINYDVNVSGSLSGGEMELHTNLRENLAPAGSMITPPSISSIFGSAETIGDGVLDRVVLLYNVEIYVYEAGTTNEVAKFIGTMNE